MCETCRQFVERKTRLVSWISCVKRVFGFCSQYFSYFQQKSSALCKKSATRKKARSRNPSPCIKKRPSRSSFKWSGRRGCLDLFALNVSTDFLFVCSRILQRKVLRTLLTGRSNSDRFKQPVASSHLFYALKNKEALNKSSWLLYGAGDEARTRDILLGKEAFYH